MVAAAVLWALVSVRLAQAVLRPVRALTRSVQKIGADQTVSPVTFLSPDELGTLVEEFNEMSARLDAYHDSSKANVVRAQNILQATLAAFPNPIYVLTPDLRIDMQNAAANRLAQSLASNGALPAPLVERARVTRICFCAVRLSRSRTASALFRRVARLSLYFVSLPGLNSKNDFP